jgi:hypothetical protein
LKVKSKAGEAAANMTENIKVGGVGGETPAPRFRGEKGSAVSLKQAKYVLVARAEWAEGAEWARILSASDWIPYGRSYHCMTPSRPADFRGIIIAQRF